MRNGEEMKELAETFVVDSDQKADWALERIIEQRKEISRIEKLYVERKAELASKYLEITSAIDLKIAHLEGLLEAYLNTIDCKPTKAGTKKYRLLSGSIAMKRQEPKYETNNEALVQWLLSAGRTDLVNTQQTPAWGELKKEGIKVLPDGTVCTYDGEVINGVTAEIRPEKFVVEV